MSMKSIKRHSYLDLIDESESYRYDEKSGEWAYDSAEGLTRSDVQSRILERATRLESVGAVYQRADRIITGAEVEVIVSDSKELTEPSMTDGVDIILNGNLIKDVIDTDSIIALNGINYHELGHIIFTPRSGSNLASYIETNGYRRAFNMLEDSRTERLLTTLYPTTGISLEAMAYDYILNDNPSNWGNHYTQVTGRNHIAQDVRQAIADKFVDMYGSPLATQVQRIIAEYRTLSFPNDFDKAKQLIAEFASLVGKDNTPPPTWGKGGHGNRPLPERGKPKAGSEQQKLQGKAINPEGEGTDGTPETPDTNPDNEQDKPSEEKDKDKELTDKINSLVQNVKQDKRLQREVTETRRAISGSTDHQTKLTKGVSSETSVSPEGIYSARKFAQELERLVRDNDPKWETHLPSGNLNIMRTMNPDVNAINEMFDVWDMGSEDNEIEACILLDNSGSMGSLMRQVCEASWIIKRGIESINGSVSAYYYNSQSYIMYSRDEKAKPQTLRYVGSTGYTNPYRGLLEAERVLTTTDKPNKIAFLVTDGQWDKSSDCDSTIKRMKEQGVLVVTVFITSNTDEAHKVTAKARAGDEVSLDWLKFIGHGADIFHAVSDPKQLVELATRIVKDTIKSKKAN